MVALSYDTFSASSFQSLPSAGLLALRLKLGFRNVRCIGFRVSDCRLLRFLLTAYGLSAFENVKVGGAVYFLALPTTSIVEGHGKTTVYFVQNPVWLGLVRVSGLGLCFAGCQPKL